MLVALAGCPQLNDDDFGSGGALNSGGRGGSGGAGPDVPVAGACNGGVARSDCSGTGGTGLSLPDASAEAGDSGDDCGPGAARSPRGECFFADATASAWSDARASCQGRGKGWDLAAIRSAEENDFVLALTGFEAWLGGTDAVDEGRWTWVPDGELFFDVAAPDAGVAYAPWSSGEPNDLDDSDCMRMLTTGLWADWACAGSYGHVCQRRAP